MCRERSSQIGQTLRTNAERNQMTSETERMFIAGLKVGRRVWARQAKQRAQVWWRKQGALTPTKRLVMKGQKTQQSSCARMRKLMELRDRYAEEKKQKTTEQHVTSKDKFEMFLQQRCQEYFGPGWNASEVVATTLLAHVVNAVRNFLYVCHSRVEQSI